MYRLEITHLLSGQEVHYEAEDEFADHGEEAEEKAMEALKCETVLRVELYELIEVFVRKPEPVKNGHRPAINR